MTTPPVVPAPGQEISVSPDAITVGDNLSVPADRLATGDGVLYVLANKPNASDGSLSVHEERAVLAAFDDAGVERWRIELDRTPTDVVVVDGDPWVLQGAWSTQDAEPTVTRIDAVDGRILGQVELDVFAVSDWIVGSFGAVWIAVQQTSFADRPNLVRVDPDLSTTQIDLPSNGLDSGCDSCRGPRIVGGAGALWVPLGNDGVAMVDPDTNQVTVIPRDTIGHPVYDVSVDGDVVYAASFGRVTSLVDRHVVATAVTGPISYLGPVGGTVGVLLEDGQFLTLRANDPMGVALFQLSTNGQYTYGLAASDGETWIETDVAGSWGLSRLQLVPLTVDSE
ncbi:MAG TPA: hypothetical protein VMS14_09970, partial [Ilumatobacteraceae bacterium]|nr:hypothetical protein [Ilumatobacteraceae bacterium]